MQPQTSCTMLRVHSGVSWINQKEQRHCQCWSRFWARPQSCMFPHPGCARCWWTFRNDFRPLFWAPLLCSSSEFQPFRCARVHIVCVCACVSQCREKQSAGRYPLVPGQSRSCSSLVIVVTPWPSLNSSFSPPGSNPLHALRGFWGVKILRMCACLLLLL